MPAPIERADNRPRSAAGACAGDSPCERSCHDESETRDGNCGRRRDEGADCSPHTDADTAADARAFGRLGPFLEFLPRLHTTEVALPSVIGHDHADVVQVCIRDGSSNPVSLAGGVRAFI